MPGKDMPADGLSRLPEFATLNAIVSIFDHQQLREHLQSLQQQCVEPWFIKLQKQAISGSRVVQVRDSVLCKLVDDTFCPIVPKGVFRTFILRELHGTALGGHLGYAKLLKLV